MSKNVIKIYPVDFDGNFNSDELSYIKEWVTDQGKDSIVSGSYEVIQFSSVKFLDSGENLKRINCPLCGKEISLVLWQKLLRDFIDTDKGYNRDLLHQLPCGHSFNLHSLMFKSKCAFSSSVISFEVHSTFWMGWLRKYPWLDYIEAKYS